MTRWSNLQRGGLTWGQRPLKSNAQRAWTEIRRATDTVDVLYLAGSNAGVGRHKTDLAVDMQAGRGNDGPHQKTADYVLANWDRLGVRYMAWDGYEYHQAVRGTGAPAPREQTYRAWWDYSSDAQHRNHVHIDWWDNSPNGADPNVPIGSAFSNFKPGVSQEVLDMLADLDYADVTAAQKDLGLVTDGVAGPITTRALENEMSKLDDLATEVQKTKVATGETLNLVRAYLLGAPLAGVNDVSLDKVRERGLNEGAALADIHHQITSTEDGNSVASKVRKTNDGVGDLVKKIGA